MSYFLVSQDSRRGSEREGVREREVEGGCAFSPYVKLFKHFTYNIEYRIYRILDKNAF